MYMIKNNPDAVSFAMFDGIESQACHINESQVNYVVVPAHALANGMRGENCTTRSTIFTKCELILI